MAVDDAVDVDVADVSFLGQAALQLAERRVKDAIPAAPVHAGAHFTGRGTDVAGKQQFVLEVDVDRVHVLRAVEKGADRDFTAPHPPEYLDRVGIHGLVGLQDVYDVHAIVFLADEQQPLDVLRLAARLDDVGGRIGPHEFDRRIEIHEFVKRDDRYAVAFQFRLAERTVVFESIGMRGAADDVLTGVAQPFRMFALPEHVVEHDHVRPVDVTLVVVDFRYETVRDRALGLVGDVIPDFLPFPADLPRHVADQSVERYEQEFLDIGHRIQFPCGPGGLRRGVGSRRFPVSRPDLYNDHRRIYQHRPPIQRRRTGHAAASTPARPISSIRYRGGSGDRSSRWTSTP